MSYFCVPEHTEHTHCDCITSSGSKCSRQAKYRFVYEHRVDYTCGIKSHMVPDKENRSSFFVQRKLTPKGKWTWLYTKCSESNPQDPPTPPKRKNDSGRQEAQRQEAQRQEAQWQEAQRQEAQRQETQSLQETIRVQKNTIAIQKSAVESLRIQVQQLKLLAERTAKTAPVDEFQTKMNKSTKDALRTATSTNSVKNLKFQLHPDKHPQELRWLFEELFKGVNV